MGWRFRRSVKVFPGVRVNFGKKGFTSTTVGKGLFSANINSDGIRTNHNLPGTCLTYQTEREPFVASTPHGQVSSSTAGWMVAAVLGIVIGGCAFCGWIGSQGPSTPVSNSTAAPLKSSYTPAPSPTAAGKGKKKGKTATTPSAPALADLGGSGGAGPSAASGATAICRDGSSSYSSSHRGACSHHGGVARWLQ